jgi:hypothetical protein
MPGGTNKSGKEKSQPQISPPLPGALFLGTWNQVNDKGVISPYMTVTDSAATKEHLPNSAGTWEVVGNEARFTWEDGSRDILRLEADGNVTMLSFGKPAGGRNDQPEFRCRALRTVTPMLIWDDTTSGKPRAPSTDRRPLRTGLAEIRHDFQQIAQQAPWVCATFVPVQGRMMFGLARRNEGNRSDSEMRGMSPGGPEAAVIAELYLLTDRAGAIVAELCLASLLDLPTVRDGAEPFQYWQALLTSKAITRLFTAEMVWPDGSPVGEFIGNFAQVSATAAAWLLDHHCPEPPLGKVGRPATYTEKLIEFVMRQQAKKPRPKWEIVFLECKKKFPGARLPKKTAAFKRQMQRVLKKLRESQARETA